MIETQPWPSPDAPAPTRRPWWKKVNPLWWFGNEEGIDPGYHLDWPQWRRAVMWYVVRNPMFNFFRFVVGVEDRALMVTGPAPVFVTFWHEAQPPRLGWKWSVIRTGWLVLPFVSYCSAGWQFYIGWMPSGGRLTAMVVRR